MWDFVYLKLRIFFFSHFCPRKLSYHNNDFTVYYPKGLLWFPLLLFICIANSQLFWEYNFVPPGARFFSEITLELCLLIYITSEFSLLIYWESKLCTFMQKEREKSENRKGLLPQSCCCHRAANEEKTAAWISSAVEGKMRAQQRL